MFINTYKHEMTISALGNVFTWYCFALFMPFLYILSSEFFSSDDMVLNHFLTFFVMSVGLFVRPLGASVFGPIGDRFGRTKAISISILLMAIPTFCIGLLPTFDSVGILSPILLIICRALQGISMGGEYTATMVHLVERAPQNRRGFFGSWSDAGSQIGVLLSAGSLLVICSCFSEQEIRDFAWRIPFLLSCILIPFAFWIPKRNLVGRVKEKEQIISLLIDNRKAVGCSIAITAFSAVGFYSVLSFLPFYLETQHILTLDEATLCSVYANVVMIASILIFGFLSDRYNRKTFLLLGVGSASVVIIIMFLSQIRNFEFWLVMNVLYGFAIGIYYSCRSAFFAEAFPTKIRCTAVSVSLGFAQAIFGGVTNILMNYLRNFSEILLVIPIILVTFCAFYCISILEDRTGKELL